MFTVHGKTFGGEKIANLANSELFAIFLANSHGYTIKPI